MMLKRRMGFRQAPAAFEREVDGMITGNGVELLRELADILERETKTVAALVALCRELDIELDGVRVPASAAACVNAMRSLLKRIDEGDGS